MASVYSAVECPHCERSAMEDYYYKINVGYIVCSRCGYNAVRSCMPEEAKRYGHEIQENLGYGVCFQVSPDGRRKMTLLNCYPDNLEEFKLEIENGDPELKESYLITFLDGVFEILLGNPPENFHLTFEEYKEKMYEKYGGFEEFDGLVPIEN